VAGAQPERQDQHRSMLDITSVRESKMSAQSSRLSARRRQLHRQGHRQIGPFELQNKDSKLQAAADGAEYIGGYTGKYTGREAGSCRCNGAARRSTSRTAPRICQRPGRVVAIDHIDLKVARGEFLCIVGPSGCGKSTLLRILAGLDRQSSGTIR